MYDVNNMFAYTTFLIIDIPAVYSKTFQISWRLQIVLPRRKSQSQ